MRNSDRILLILLGIIDIAAGAYLAVARIIGQAIPYIDELLNKLLGNDAYFVCINILLVLFLIIVGTSLVVIALNSLKYKRYKRNDVVMISNDGASSAAITTDALRVIAKKKCMTFRFVSECSADVEAKAGIVSLVVRICPFANVELPAAISELQTQLAESVQAQTGLTVGSVDVTILPSIAKKG